MSFCSNWDVDKYKSEFESEEHWKLRRKFMLAHKDKFPEERLVCLAQVFFNVEFLGCRYPEKTMKLVEQLSKEVAAEHREQQKTKIQRTFVKASDAAGAKIKGLKRGAENASLSQSKEAVGNVKQIKLESHSEAGHRNDYYKDHTRYTTDTLGNKFEMSLSSSYNQAKEKKQSINDDDNGNGNDRIYSDRKPVHSLSYSSGSGSGSGSNSWLIDNNNISKSREAITIDEIRRKNGPCGNMVVFVKVGEHPTCSLSRTAREWNKTFKSTVIRENDLWSASVSLDGVKLGTCVDPVLAVARKKAAQSALDQLMESYFSVKIKCAFCGGNEVVKTTGKEINSKTEPVDGNSRISDHEAQSSCKEEDVATSSNADGNSSKSGAADVETPLDDDNIGLKLLKMMGWSGGGLGKNQQGIAEPIKPVGLGKSRAGFGSVVKGKKGCDSSVTSDKTGGQDLLPIKHIIREYKFSNNFNDLVFSPEFTKEQRTVLHRYAQKLGLKTKSFGGKNEETRHLVIFKKIDPWTIIDGLVKNVDQFFNKYELLRPGKLMINDSV